MVHDSEKYCVEDENCQRCVRDRLISTTRNYTEESYYTDKAVFNDIDIFGTGDEVVKWLELVQTNLFTSVEPVMDQQSDVQKITILSDPPLCRSNGNSLSKGYKKGPNIDEVD